MNLPSLIVAFALVAPAVAWHVRCLLIAPPFHLVADEQRSYRTISLLTVGLMLTGAPLASVSPWLWATAALLTAFVGSRIGSRLHVARPMVARLRCVPLPEAPGVDGPVVDNSAVLRCTSGGTHQVTDPVSILMTPRIMSRSALRDLPYTLVGGAHESHIPAAVAFLRAARECGCLVLVDEDVLEPSGESTSYDRSRGAA